MSDILYTMSSETVRTILAHNEHLATQAGDMARQYGIEPEHVLVLSGFLHKKLPKGQSASKSRLEALCRKVQSGEMLVISDSKQFQLLREASGSPAPLPKRIRWKRRLDPMGMVLFAMIVLLGIAAACAVGYVLYLLFVKLFL